MSKQSEQEATPRRPWMKYAYIALFIVIVSSGLNWIDGQNAKAQKQVIANNSAVQAETNLRSDICKYTPEEPLCEVARQVTKNPTKPVPGPTGPQGPPGKDGKVPHLSINSFTCEGGDLKLSITYGDKTATETAPGACTTARDYDKRTNR